MSERIKIAGWERACREFADEPDDKWHTVTNTGFREIAALLRLARAAKAEDMQRVRLLRGERIPGAECDATLHELYEALEAFDFGDEP